jgi:type VI secretion system protein ImpE
MTASELYQAGRLAEAIATATAEVKKHPTDTARRGFLFELLCFAAEWERADKQLETMVHQDPSVAVSLGLLRQLVRAEVWRQQFFDEGRVPELLGEPSAVLQLHLQASIELRAGNAAEAATLLSQAEAARPKVSGSCDGHPFDDWRDLDDLTACVFEVLTSTGKYFWIPVEQVESIEFHPPQRPQDLLWRRAHMIVAGGPDGEVYLPTIYPATRHADDEQLRLGRGTEWQGEEGQPIRGLGQRMFLVGDHDHSILQLTEVTFEVAAASND